MVHLLWGEHVASRQGAPLDGSDHHASRGARHAPGPADRGVPGHAAHRGRRLGGRQRVRRAGGRLLAPRRRPVTALRRREPHRLRRADRRRRQGDRRRPRGAGHRDLGARVLPEPAAPRPRAPRRGDRPPRSRLRRGRAARRPGRQHVHRQRQGPAASREHGRVQAGVARHRGSRRRSRRADRDRELPDDLLPGRVAGRQQPDAHAGRVAGGLRAPRRRHASASTSTRPTSSGR